MSREKHTRYELDPERERRSQLLTELGVSKRTLAGLAQEMTTLLGSVSPGLRLEFVEPLADAQAWLDESNTETTNSEVLTVLSTAVAIAAQVADTKRRSDGGRSLIKRVRDNCVLPFKTRRQGCEVQLRGLASQVESHCQVIARWNGERSQNGLRTNIREIATLIQDDHLSQAETKLCQLGKDVEFHVRDALGKEDESLRHEGYRLLQRVYRDLVARTDLLQGLLDSTSPGIRSTFQSEISRGERWITDARIAQDRARGLTEATALDSLKRVASELDSMQLHVESLQHEITHAFSTTADQLRSAAEEQVVSVERVFAGGQELLEKWLQPDALQHLGDAVAAVRELLCHDRLLEVDGPAQAILSDLHNRLAIAEDSEAKHQKRLYVLGGLRHVCAAAGFEQASAPTYEREGDRNSRIVFTVDTLDQGLITFHLTLDSIEANASIPENHCLDEFDKLSAQLLDRYGVRTEFQSNEPNPRPVRVHSEARQEPRPRRRSA